MSGLEPVKYSFEYSSFTILLFHLRTNLWVLLSIHFVGSFLIFANCWFSSNQRHFSVYLKLFVITTPLPLFCFKTLLVLLFVRLAMICWYLYGTFILLSLWHTLRSLLFNCVNSFSGMCEMFNEMFWSNNSNSVSTPL